MYRDRLLFGAAPRHKERQMYWSHPIWRIKLIILSRKRSRRKRLPLCKPQSKSSRRARRRKPITGEKKILMMKAAVLSSVQAGSGGPYRLWAVRLFAGLWHSADLWQRIHWRETGQHSQQKQELGKLLCKSSTCHYLREDERILEEGAFSNSWSGLAWRSLMKSRFWNSGHSAAPVAHDVMTFTINQAHANDEKNFIPALPAWGQARHRKPGWNCSFDAQGPETPPARDQAVGTISWQALPGARHGQTRCQSIKPKEWFDDEEQFEAAGGISKCL